LNSGDAVVFLASDTSKGVLAAHLNAACLGHTIEYYNFPPRGPEGPDVQSPGSGAPCHDRAVRVIRIHGLVPDSTDRLRDAAGDLARALAWARSAAPEPERLVIHVAGGYKAVVPIVVGIAEHLPHDKPAREVWCKHEESDQAVKLPLRKLEVTGQMPGALDAVYGNRQPVPNHWEEYAYRRIDGLWQLTELGYALRELAAAIHGAPPGGP
jgi:hypothetical protein